jgi:PAS domain S-box-containing protein
MAEAAAQPEDLDRRVGVGTKAVNAARGDAQRLKTVFERSPVPMVMVDAERRFVDVNRAGRLWFRLSLVEVRVYAIDDLAPPDQLAAIAQTWARLLETGLVAGSFLGVKPDGSRIPIVYSALAQVLPGRHVIVFAPAEWPEDELGLAVDRGLEPAASLTPREIEVLALAASGLQGPEVARELVVSPSTVKTHFKHIYAKLNVRNRGAAVAKAQRLGVIG